LEYFSGQNSLREHARFILQRQLSWVAAFHEPREHLLNQCRARPEFLVEMILNETSDSVVKSVRQRERCAPFTASFAIACPDVSEEFLDRISGRRFGKRRGDKLSAVIVRAADQNLFPRLAMRRLEIVS